jgi:hypothetical protein
LKLQQAAFRSRVAPESSVAGAIHLAPSARAEWRDYLIQIQPSGCRQWHVWRGLSRLKLRKVAQRALAHFVKVGTIRSELMTVFTTEGGLATSSQRTYVYRQCPYIKVDVKFAASSREEELPADRIVQISRPYLAWLVVD